MFDLFKYEKFAMVRCVDKSGQEPTAYFFLTTDMLDKARRVVDNNLIGNTQKQMLLLRYSIAAIKGNDVIKSRFDLIYIFSFMMANFDKFSKTIF